jgi:hypothetical protein
VDEVLLTIDIDWAPDFAVDCVADRLLAHGVRATWFITHLSPAIRRLTQYPVLFELGIHPNFLPGSTHGETPEAVLRHCLALVPTASSMRTHGLVQSTQLLRQIAAHGSITADVSTFLPYAPDLQPVPCLWSDCGLLRIPFFWADDHAMEQPVPSWQLAPLLALGKGLKVFAFHPIHLYLNAPNIRAYQALKRRAPVLTEATRDMVAEHVQTGEGPLGLFNQVIAHLESRGRSLSIRDLYERSRLTIKSPA